MLVPVLLILTYFVAKDVAGRKDREAKGKITIPWFAILFLVVIGFNSLNLLPTSAVESINTFDTFLLTMAMAALGAETSFEKFKKAGFKPFLLAFLLWTVGIPFVDMADGRRLRHGEMACPDNWVKPKHSILYQL